MLSKCWQNSKDKLAKIPVNIIENIPIIIVSYIRIHISFRIPINFTFLNTKQIIIMIIIKKPNNSRKMN
jgi:hypothetical protein